MTIFLSSRPRWQGAFHERQETRGGERWPLGAKDVSHPAEAQAAHDPIRQTGDHGCGACCGKGLSLLQRESRATVVGNNGHPTRGCAEQATHTARGTPELFGGPW